MNNLVIEDSSSDSEYETSSSEENYGELINNNWMPDRPNMPNIPDRPNMHNMQGMPNLYNGEYKTINILVDTSTISKSVNFNTSNYVYHLNLTDFSSSNINSISENNTGGFDKYTDVIGFRLVNAIIPNTAYTIRSDNNMFAYKKCGDDTIYTINLTNKYCTPDDLNSSLPDIDNPCNIKFEWINDIWKYHITSESTSGIQICWDYNDKTKCLGSLMGYYSNIKNEYSNDIYSNVVAELSANYVDVVIDEIPYIACKHNSYGRRIIDRIPLDNEYGDLKYYEPRYRNSIDYSKLFFPITLDKLTIKLYGNCQNFFDNQQGNHNIEFELTLKN